MEPESLNTIQRTSVNLLDLIRSWQREAIRIVPPEDTGICRARGGVAGAAFFPEGYGLKYPTRDSKWPTLMAIGHNFGCMGYRNRLEARGHEDDKPTWRNLERLLADAGLADDCCYMTNWFIGLSPGEKQVGKFLCKPVVHGVEVPDAGVRANVVALLHPSLSPPNQRLRRGLSAVRKPEVEMVRLAISG